MNLKKIRQTNKIDLQGLYLQIHFENNRKKFRMFSFELLLHKKLQYFCFYIANKKYTPSTGYLFGSKLNKIKFFKKSRKSIGASIAALNKKTQKQIQSIEYFFCKNYNFRNYL